MSDREPPFDLRLKVGAMLPELLDGPLEVSDFVRYQAASGDFNPIHYDTAYCEALGLPGPFAVGLRQAAVAGGWLAELFGAASVRGLRVRWAERAWPGDVLHYTGHVTAIRAAPAGDTCLGVAFEVRRGDGGIHLSGTAHIEIAADE